MQDVDFDFDAELYEYNEVGTVAWGKINNDSSGRWKNGTVIRTSSIKDRFLDDDDNILGIQTRNTVYRVTTDKFETADQSLDLKANIGTLVN